MKSSRSVLLSLSAMTLAVSLAACGGAGQISAPSDSSAGTAAASGSSTSASTGTRTVVDATGKTVEVPVDPQRVVPLHFAGAAALLDLGVVPAAWPTSDEEIIPEDQVKTVKALPQINPTEPSVESLAGMNPDLVVAHNASPENLVTQLEKVAPVYSHTLRGGKRAEWWTRVDEIADAVNKTEKAQSLRADFEKRQKELATKYAEKIKGKKVAVVGSYSENNLYVWGAENMTGTILVPLGFSWSDQANKSVAAESEPEAEISLERLEETLGDADIIFYDTNLREKPGPLAEAMMKSPQWSQLKAVKAGQAFPGGKNTIASYADAHYLLDRVEDALKSM